MAGSEAHDLPHRGAAGGAAGGRAGAEAAAAWSPRGRHQQRSWAQRWSGESGRKVRSSRGQSCQQRSSAQDWGHKPELAWVLDPLASIAGGAGYGIEGLGVLGALTFPLTDICDDPVLG